MKPPVKRSKTDLVLNLMIFSGMMLIVTALPVGLVMTLQFYAQFHAALRDAAWAGAIMTALIAVTGGTLLPLGMYLLKRHKRSLSPRRP
jgi:hypothetical protein